MGAPCSNDPEKWFGYQDMHSHVNQAAVDEARMICLTACPLARQRRCAKEAVVSRSEFGVWAGVELPGATYRKKPQLEAARLVLGYIAANVIDADQLRDNVELLESA